MEKDTASEASSFLLRLDRVTHSLPSLALSTELTSSLSSMVAKIL